MKARFTVKPDANVLALHRMLAENGRWLVQVHCGRIVKIAKVPKDIPVGDFLNDDDGPFSDTEQLTAEM